MSINVLASLPENVGKRIHHGFPTPYVVGADEVCDCGKQATVLIKGETDSYGFEIMPLCQACFESVKGEVNQHLAATDVEDRSPAEGYVFCVNEGNNADNGVTYLCSFTSYRKALGYYRAITTRAASQAGLYPDAGVRTVTCAQYRKWADAEQEERDWENSHR